MKYSYLIRELFGREVVNSTYFYEWESAQVRAGSIIDGGPYLPDTKFDVVITKQTGEDEPTMIIDIKDFLAMPNPEITTHIPKVNFDIALEDRPELGHVLDKEPFHHLDEDETKEVLMYTETGFLVGEIVRRLEEYDRSVTEITKILDDMKIYI